MMANNKAIAKRKAGRRDDIGRTIYEGDFVLGVVDGDVERGEVIYRNGEFYVDVGYPKWKPYLRDFITLEKIKSK